MKVLLINGSPREHGNTFTALSEVAKTLHVRHGLQRSHARRSLTENRKIILAKKGTDSSQSLSVPLVVLSALRHLL